MTFSALFLFVLAYALALASPGPGNGSVVARVLGGGLSGIGFYILGILAGDLVWLTAAAFGLALLAQTYAGVFLVIKWCGAAYLLYLAIRLWRAPASAAPLGKAGRETSKLAHFLTGFSITLGNPKAMAFFLALLPGVVDLAHLSGVDFAVLCAISAGAVFGVMGAYALGAGKARQALSKPVAVRWLNRATGVALAASAGWIVTR